MKIFNQILNSNNPAQDFITSSLPFMIEGDKWEYVSDINEATIIPVHYELSNIPQNLRSDQILLVIALYHIDDMMYTDSDVKRVLSYIHRFHDKVIFVHTNHANTDPHCIFYDHMFNREKLYFVDYEKFGDDILSNKTWTIGCSREIYRQNPITKTPIKQVLSPTRIYNFGSDVHPRMSFRQRLTAILYRRANAYMGDTQNGIVLESNSSSSDINSRIAFKEGGTWYPVADHYYNTSYVSVYVETLTQNNRVRGVTEKSFDPLMKGNFILPFGYPGLIRDLQELYGFKLPNWIDYSYDDILDPEERFQAFLVSLDDLLKKDLKDLHRLYLEDKHILLHNRQVFIDKQYDKLHDKIMDVIEIKGWDLPKTV
jgi:hypothetical protein